MKLTTHLLTTTPDPLKTATTHPFLAHAGSGTLPKETLAQWLSQDRLYAQAYVRFMGLLLSKVHLPLVPTSPENKQLENGKGLHIHEKIFNILVDALNNIKTELGFFERTAWEYGIDLNTPPPILSETQAGQTFGAGPITQGYIDMFMDAGAPGTSLLEGLVVLWATEECYLRAWRYALSFLEKRENEGQGQDTDGGALREKFIPNWASKGFEEFVVKIADVLDEVAQGELGENLGEQEQGEILGLCERWWRKVVWLEERFWPDVRE
ncbi:putative transcription regulator PAB1642 [Aspergillus undulatus]|uniref:putative transcription regulator PAB1642 n=1 Tax=Aspergillus undulatus TaxID=1810928 RepID=UPI003CCC9CFE